MGPSMTLKPYLKRHTYSTSLIEIATALWQSPANEEHP